LSLGTATPSMSNKSIGETRSWFFSLRPSANLENRSKERYRRLAWTAATSAISRGASVLSALISVPLTIEYLGTQRFALWMTINSLMAMLMFADLGLGNGLLTAISESHGKDDAKMARRYISSAFFMLLALGTCTLLVLGIIYQYTPWAHLLGVRSGGAESEAAPAAAIFFVCLAFNLPLGIVQRIQMGFQSGYTNNVWNGFGALLGFGGVLTCAYFKAGVPWLVLSFGAGPMIATILNGVQLFRSRPDLLPAWNEFRWAVLRQLLSVGLGFLIVQAALAMAIGSDNFVIAHLLGPDAVAEYSIAMRVFTLVPALLQMVLMPLWPAYGESLARGNAEWAIRALKRSIVVGAIVTIAAAVALTLSGRWIITLWVGNQFHQGLWLLSGMGVWMVVTMLANVISIFLNGMNRIHAQVASAIAVATSTLAIELLATPKFGLPAMIWSTNISYLCFVWIPVALFFPRLLKNIKSSTEPRRDVSAEPILAVN
jgi:O-antigen/teichoic acid export membrane protein